MVDTGRFFSKIARATKRIGIHARRLDSDKLAVKIEGNQMYTEAESGVLLTIKLIK
jgi:hypothetical protein